MTYTRQEVLGVFNLLKGSSLAEKYPDFVEFLEAVWDGNEAVFNATNREGVGLYSKSAVLALLERIEKEVIGDKATKYWHKGMDDGCVDIDDVRQKLSAIKSEVSK